MELLTDKQYKAALYEQNRANYEALKGTDCYTLMFDDGSFKVFDARYEIVDWVIDDLKDDEVKEFLDYLKEDPDCAMWENVEGWCEMKYGEHPEHMEDMD